MSGVCDFCNAELREERWLLPIRHLPRDDDGNWVACPTCAGFISRGQWSVVTRRGVQGWEKIMGRMMPPGLQLAISRKYSLVRRHAAGRITRESM